MLRPAFRLVAFVLGALLLAPTSSIAAPSATTLPQVPAESLPTLPSPAPPAEITPTCGAFCESAGIAPRTVSGNYHLDAWGNYRNPEELEASKNRFGFTGHLFDRETGTYYAKARYFDPGLGRFLSQDTYLGEIDNPPSIHRYTWAHNRPTVFIDPSGNIAILSDFQERIDGLRKGIVDIGTDFAEYAGRNQALRMLGLDRKIAEGTGRLAGVVGAAGDAVGATNFAVNLGVLRFAESSTLGQEAAVELGESISAVRQTWKVVSTDPLGVAGRALNSVQETTEAAMRGDYRAIADVNEQAARIAVDLALGSKGTTAAARGTREVAESAARRLGAGSKELAAPGGRHYLGPHYEQLKKLHAENPDFFPDPDAASFKVVTGKEGRAKRAAFVASGEKGHHVHPIAHGGSAVPEGRGLAYTGETTVPRPAGIEFPWMKNPRGKMGDFYVPDPETGLLLPGRNPAHTQATKFWRQVEEWQRALGLR